MATGARTDTPITTSSADTAFDSYRDRARFSNLDGLRFICISMVLWHHNPFPSAGAAQIFKRGFLGVDFFFVLSGFLITTLLLREMAQSKAFSLRNFYIRRIIRIIPVYFFVVSAVATYHIVIKGRYELLELLPYYYLFLSNFLTDHIPLLTVTWSLSVEEQYYMLWPFLLLLLPLRFLAPVCLSLIALNVAGAIGVFGTSTLRFGYLHFHLPTATYAPILMGSLAALWLHNRASFKRLYVVAHNRYTAVLAGLFLIGYLQLGALDVVGLPNLIIHLTMTFILIALVIQEDTPLAPFLTHPMVKRVGMVSYGIYLYHLIALDLVLRVQSALGPLPFWLVLIAYSTLAYIMAEISFRTLEAWFQRFRPQEKTA